MRRIPLEERQIGVRCKTLFEFLFAPTCNDDPAIGIRQQIVDHPFADHSGPAGNQQGSAIQSRKVKFHCVYCIISLAAGSPNTP